MISSPAFACYSCVIKMGFSPAHHAFSQDSNDLFAPSTFFFPFPALLRNNWHITYAKSLHCTALSFAGGKSLSVMGGTTATTTPSLSTHFAQVGDDEDRRMAMRLYVSCVYDTEADGGVGWRNVQLFLNILYFIKQGLGMPCSEGCLGASQSSSICLIVSQESSQILVLGYLAVLF